MKVIIAGGRDIEDYDLLCQVVRDSGLNILTVISGTARGVDRMGERWASQQGIPCERYPANWDKFGKAAGPIRNIEMSKVGDALIAIRKDGSRGTAHMIETMTKLGKPVFVHWIGKGSYKVNYD